MVERHHIQYQAAQQIDRVEPAASGQTGRRGRCLKSRCHAVTFIQACASSEPNLSLVSTPNAPFCRFFGVVNGNKRGSPYASVKSGLYGNASEVVRDALRRAFCQPSSLNLDEDTPELAALIYEGLNSRHTP